MHDIHEWVVYIIPVKVNVMSLNDVYKIPVKVNVMSLNDVFH